MAWFFSFGSNNFRGVLLGLDHKTASDFTFIMARPIMAGASGLSLVKNWDQINFDHLSFYIIGFVSAFVFALISIKFFLKLISRVKLVPFAIYRLVLAAILIVVLYL